MRQFQMEVMALDTDAKSCLEDSFRTLHSSDKAFRVLQCLLESRPRKDIARLFEERYTDILNQYDKELRLIETTFTEGSQDSGHFASVLGPRYLPPVSSSICWVRNLQARITSPMLKLLNIRRLMESDKGKEVQDHYLCLVQRMTRFEEDLFNGWRQQVHECLGRLLERNLWKYAESSKPASASKGGHFGRMGAPISKRRSTIGQELPKQSHSVYKFNFEVDFGNELVQIMEETKFLQMLGFPVPDMACCIALREKEFLRQRTGLSNLAEAVRTTLGRLSMVELVTLENHIADLRVTLAPAWKQLNWTSLIIDRYIVKATKAFDRFSGVLHIMEKAKAKIEANLNAIARASLFCTYSSKSTAPISFKPYLQQAADARMREFEDLSRKHTEIGTVLVNMEEAITGKAATGKEPKMLHLYEHWERRCFDTVHQMVIDNLRRFLESLQTPSKPLFEVDLMLSGSEVVSAPQPMEFYQYQIQDVRDAIKQTQVFIRWQPGTCLPSQGIKAPEQEGIFYFTFHLDLAKSVAVKELIQHIDSLIFRAGEELKRHLEKYRQYKHLFALHKKSSVEKWKSCNPSISAIDQRINDVANQLHDLLASIADSQIGFFTLRTGLLIKGIQMHTEKWVATYGDLLRERAQTVGRQLRDTIQTFLPCLQVRPSERNRLKSLLSTIRGINDVRAESEERLACIAECHRLLQQHNLKVTTSEINEYEGLRRAWIELLKQARATERSLSRPRKVFKYSTKVEANRFFKEIKKFLQRFKDSGPIAVGEDLDWGLELMKDYKEELQGLTATYNELLSAERLFDLPVTHSEELINVQRQMDCLDRIYSIYADYKSLLEEWSKVLWRDVHFSVLQNEVERLQQTFQKLPEQIRQMGVGRVLKTQLSGFCDSVALLKDLKHEAFRQRHWSMLMERIKHAIVLNPEKFTLGNVFNVHLDQFRKEVDEILSTALKELSIEKNFLTLKDTWNSLQLQVKDYAPEGTKRGSIVGGLEEVIQTLDDSSLSLQSMSTSRFAEPFVGEIRGLEKVLTQASEVLEIWVQVQRKWLHLEGLFSGSDVHTRIPKEAGRFDKINLIFKKTVEEATKNSYVRNWCLKPGRVRELQSIIMDFEICQKSLTAYLKTKRNVFPRFFFISDNELLMMLGSSEGDYAQEHIIKVFDNIIRLELDKTDQGVPLAIGMRSAEGEIMEFKQLVECTGQIEEWMTEVEREMKRSNRLITKEAIYRYRESSTRSEWALRFQGMVVLAASQVWWTWEVEDAFRRLCTENDKAALKVFARQQHSQVEELISRIRRDLSANDRTKLTTLLIIDVHSRDVVDSFVRDNIVDAKAFEWQSQLRSSSPKSEDRELIEAIEGWLTGERFVLSAKQVEKVVQLHDTMKTRHAAMVVGPTGGGKSVVIEALCGAQKKMNVVTNLITLNPKDRNVGELYGVLDCNTRDWRDGLLTKIFRDANKQSDKKTHNIVLFDGDVDSLWVENMNSVMDDNRVLTLPNGERIHLQPTCCLLFEVGNLEYASPATVSRCGMVFVDPHDLDYSALWQRWKMSHKELDTFYIQILNNLFTKYIPRLMALNLSTVITLTPISLIRQFCYLLESLLIGVLEASADCLEALFIQALTFSIGSCLSRDSDRAAFDEKVKEISALPKMERNEGGSSVPSGYLPDTHPRLEDYFFDAQSNAWVPWSSRMPHYWHDPEQNFADVVVPTRETMVMRWILEKHAEVDRPILLVGEAGTFKTTSVNRFLAERNTNTHQILRVPFSSRTTALDVYNNLNANLEKRSKGVYGPRAGKRLLLFIDDLHMPETDPFGTQQPVALLKLLLTNHGLFDRSSSNFKWRRVLDTSYLATMTTSCTGREHVDPRCLSLFSLFHAAPPRNAALEKIFSSILSGYLQTGFVKAIVEAVPAITQATLNVYSFLLQKLRPSPLKFYYNFSFRDLRRVCAGLCRMSPSRCSSLLQMARLWRHELFRVFVDRLSTMEDALLAKDKINAEAEKMDPAAKKEILCDPVLFGEYKSTLEENDTPYYEDMGDYNKIREIFSNIQERRSGHSKLVLFNYALEHLSRLHRIMSTVGGHALCVGVSGTGKAVLAKLAAFAAGCEVFRITQSQNYAKKDFREEIKALYLRLVQKDERIAFLVFEDDILDEGFLDTINRMLVGMDASSLFLEEERDKIVNEMQQEAMDAGLDGSREVFWRYFSQKAARNLHVILTMSPVGTTLRRRCTNFPGLVSNTTIDWFFAWPEEALCTVAKTILSPDNQLIPAAYYDALIDHVIHVHRSVEQYTTDFVEKWKRINYVTPKHFLDYISNYLKLLSESDQSKAAHGERFVKGVAKLEDASAQVKELNEKLVTQRAAVVQNTEACEALLKIITQNQLLASEKQTQSDQKVKEMETLSKAIEQDKAAAESALTEAMPALEQARSELGELDKSDVTELRSFVKPPRPVQVVSECICVFKGLTEVSWKAAKGLMADANFLQSLQTMDVDAIGPKQLATVKERLDASKVSVQQMQSVSRAGAGFLRFVHAVTAYCEVLRDVRPKREKVAKLEKILAQSEHDLERLKSELARLEEETEKLNKEYSTAKAECLALQEETTVIERRLAAADTLINSLSCEKIRWKAQTEKLREERRHLVGDCLVSAAFLTYTGPFFCNLRNRMLYDDWIPDLRNREVSLSEPFNLVNLLTDNMTLTNWKDAGLPEDDLSIQNGILTMRASRFPLLIDPHQQALKWIKRLEGNNNLRVATFNDPDFLKSLELSIKFGTPFLFEDVGDYVDPIIHNVLTKNIQEDRNQNFVMLGYKEVEYDRNFRLYLNTKLSNPAYGPKLFGNAVVINCGITEEALENQLLGVILKHEQSSLEEKRTVLLSTKSKYGRILKDLEDSLLMNLTLSTGNLLDNEELISAVEMTKAKATEAKGKLAYAAKASDEVKQLSNAYRPAAKRGAMLFFVLTDMATINPMYQFALSAYIALFEDALHRSMPDTVLGKRQTNVISTLIELVYNYGCTGFFERHKLLFGFQISLKLQAEAGYVSQTEIDFFTKGDASPGKETERCPIAWLTDTKWKDIRRLEEILPSFVGLSESLVANQTRWKTWSSLGSLECEPPPYFENISDFQKLCLLRCFRVDRVCRAVELFVANTLGENFVDLYEPNLPSIYEQSHPETPILFILGPGSDPTDSLKKFVENCLTLDASTNLLFLSMGQGQESSAMKLFKTASSDGSWLVLQNCHLLLNWIPLLEKEIENTKQFHPKFRLWLTTEPAPEFPIGFLHRSLKVVIEPLFGLKRNLRSTFTEIPPSKFAEYSCPEFSVLAYTLTFFHAVVQERRQYGKLGWNIAYEFNMLDFQASLAVITDHLEASKGKSGLSWGSLHYLIEEIMYGGRVMDKFDQRVLHTYLNEYFGDFLFDAIQPFSFFSNEEVSYSLPPETSREGILRYIDTLPTKNSPEVLGMNANAEVDSSTSKAYQLWAYLLALSHEGEGGSSAATTTTAQMTLTIEAAEKVLLSLPPTFDREAVRETFKENMTPTAIVLLQELEYFNRLLLQMQSTLTHLKQAMSGEVALSSDLEEMAISIRNGQLPSLWRSLAPDTKKSLANWLTHFHRRTEQYKTWIASGEPIVIWLSGLHVPQSYLAAVVQSVCRRSAWPLDKSIIVATVTGFTDEEAVEDRSPAGCLLTGLFIEGASWKPHTGHLCLQAPHQLVQPMPLLKVSVLESRRAKRHSTLLTPVYVTSARAGADGRGFVFEADLTMGNESDASHWILQGVCLLLNDD
ncbi:Dynein heavy chain 10 axonemal [Taenia crassiceps]|uniref:Dynein heavy chain 10 axonemal n=1 Tax=Taenia crassiceps TaxID=6207 RepID=A0ABR4QT53_9CEST